MSVTQNGAQYLIYPRDTLTNLPENLVLQIIDVKACGKPSEKYVFTHKKSISIANIFFVYCYCCRAVMVVLLFVQSCCVMVFKCVSVCCFGCCYCCVVGFVVVLLFVLLLCVIVQVFVSCSVFCYCCCVYVVVVLFLLVCCSRCCLCCCFV